MILTARNVGEYLISRGIMRREQIVDDDYGARDTTRRNRNFRVKLGDRSGYFVKQVAEWDALSLETLEREARFYWLVWNDPQLEPIARLLPRFYSYEPGRHALVLELIDGEDMGAHHRRVGRFPEAIAALAGKELAHFHEAARVGAGNGSLAEEFPEHVPWILTAADQAPETITAEGSIRHLLGIIRAYPELKDGLEAGRAAWTVDSLVHGDLKWENMIIRTEAAEGGTRLHVIDWEVVHRGDPAWDVGAMIQAYLNYWVFSMPAGHDSKAADLVRHAPFRIEAMQPALRTFWRSYAAEYSPDDEQAFLRRSMMFAACRMLQTAYESVQQVPVLTPHAVLLLQLSANTLADPDDAAHRLAGI